MTQKNIPQPGIKRIVSLVMAVILTLFCTACGESKSDDSAMTEELLNSYMKALCNYNIGAMNKCCMAKREAFDDGDEAIKACRHIASLIEWKNDNISIDGNSAIAQVSITMTDEIEAVCVAALDDTVRILDEGAEDNPGDLLASAIKKRAAKAKTVTVSAEIAMTKVDNKWYIVKSLGVNRIISNIRTPVIAAFSLINE